MDPRLDSIAELLTDAQKELDEIEWDDATRPKDRGHTTADSSLRRQT